MRKDQHMLDFVRATLTERSASVEDGQQLILDFVSLERVVDDERVERDGLGGGCRSEVSPDEEGTREWGRQGG